MENIKSISDIPSRKPFGGLLFSNPTYFDVKYEINPYMQTGVDRLTAHSQWSQIVREARKRTNVTAVDYSTYDADTRVSIQDLPDAVFCANHAIPLPEGGFLLSQMHHPERQGEPEYFASWAEESGYEVKRLNTDRSFEGAGDGIWHPGRELLWLGYGYRTDQTVVDELQKRFEFSVIPLELTNEKYYHLDVCFTPLDEDTVLIIPEAFTDVGISNIDSMFETVLEVPKSEISTMPGNATVVGDGVFIDKQNTKTIDILSNHGYHVTAVDTTEFQKAGGSVDCVCLLIPDINS